MASFSALGSSVVYEEEEESFALLREGNLLLGEEGVEPHPSLARVGVVELLPFLARVGVMELLLFQAKVGAVEPHPFQVKQAVGKLYSFQEEEVGHLPFLHWEERRVFLLFQMKQEGNAFCSGQSPYWGPRPYLLSLLCLQQLMQE